MDAMTPFDAVRELAPPSTPDELELRRLLHGTSNAASALIAATECPEARALGWIALEWASAAKFAPMPESRLQEIVRFTRRLMVTAVQAEAINDELESCYG